MTDTLVDRFWVKVAVVHNECWMWLGSKTSAGYGNLYVGPQKWDYAHRVSYEIARGPIPEGLVLDHLCRNRSCVNPDHLEPVPQRINLMRGLAPYGLRGTCKHGHDVTDQANVYTRPNGQRQCRVCDRARDRARRHSS